MHSHSILNSLYVFSHCMYSHSEPCGLSRMVRLRGWFVQCPCTYILKRDFFICFLKFSGPRMSGAALMHPVLIYIYIYIFAKSIYSKNILFVVILCCMYLGTDF